MANVSSSNSLGERVPKLRFPNTKGNFFTDYTHNTVHGLFTRITQRNTEGITNVITNSAEHGLIPQRDFFDKDIVVDGNTANYYVIKSGDFVYNPRKSNQAPYGPFNCYNYMDEGIVSPLYTCLRPKIKEYTDFLLWYFKSPVWHSYIYHNGAQGGARHDRVGMTTELMNGIPINLPDINEQQKIVSLFNLIERKITIQSKLVDLLKLYKRGLLSQLFPQNGRSVPQYRFTGFVDAWEQRKFSELVIIERGGSPRPIDKFITKDENGLNWVKIGDAPEQGNYIMQTAEKIIPEGLSKTREVHPGDLILSNSMSFGKPYIMAIDGCIHDGWLLIRDTKKVFDLKFLCVLLGTDNMLNQYRAMAAGSTVNNLNKELVGCTTVSFPNLNEQQKIGKCFESLDHLITLCQRKHDFCEKVKFALLQQMFI